MAGIRELELGIPFGDSGSGALFQIGIFPVRAGKEPDLFGNYVMRYAPYPGELAYLSSAWDSLGSTGSPGMGLRAGFGRSGGSLRSEFLALRDLDDIAFFGYLDGTAGEGLDWSVGVGWRHAVTPGDDARPHAYSLAWAKTDSGYLPIYYTQTKGLSYSDSGGITARGFALSARLQWIRDDAAMGRGGIFGETALLGFENQPLVYEDRWRRWAATVGAFLPTWGWLHVCLLQLEWRPGAYHLNNAIRARSLESYGFRPDSASAWSYAALLGRDIGRHCALRLRLAYAPRIWADGRDYESTLDPVYPGFDRGQSEFTLQFRAVFRFGPGRFSAAH